MIPIYTIGYGGRTPHELATLLKEREVECLVDVRSAPYSRFRPEFGREALQAFLDSLGLRYVFLGDSLGGRPGDESCYTDGKVDYDRIRQRDFFRRGIERLRKASEQGMSVALMCSEGKPEECHRSKLIGVALEEAGLEVRHLDEQGQLQSQAAVIHRNTGGQASLFPEETGFTSRKRYQPG